VARLFDDSALDNLANTVGLVSNEPITQAGWFNTNDLTVNQTIISNGNNGVSGFYRMLVLGTSVDDPLRGSKQDDGAVSANVETSTSVSINTWSYGLLVFTSNTSRTISLDGAGVVTNITNIPNDPTPDFTSIGVLRRTTDTQFFSGLMAHCAIWITAIPDTMRSALANGVNPFAIRNDALVMYAPINGLESPEPDYAGQNNFTVTGTTKGATNPPVELLENYL